MSRQFLAALADMPAARWAAAIAVRHSTRTYTGAPVAPEMLDRLQSYCDGLPGTEVARVVLVREAPDEVFTGIVGGYGRVIGAPSAFLVIGNEARPGVQESAGYLGEAAILEATALGLGTCWIAGFFDRGLASSLVPLSPRERVLAISPVGNGQTQPRRGEKIMKRMARSHKRKLLKEIAPGLDPGVWPAWAMQGLEMARATPSAANRQPWRFAFEPPGAVTVSSTQGGYEGNVSRRLDCGIAMLHFEIGARSAGTVGRWERLESPAVARYRASATGDVPTLSPVERSWQPPLAQTP